MANSAAIWSGVVFLVVFFIISIRILHDVGLGTYLKDPENQGTRIAFGFALFSLALALILLPVGAR